MVGQDRCVNRRREGDFGLSHLASHSISNEAEENLGIQEIGEGEDLDGVGRGKGGFQG